MATVIEAVNPQFNELNGEPLENGYIYIGTDGLDPITNPITVYCICLLRKTMEQTNRAIRLFPLMSFNSFNSFWILS